MTGIARGNTTKAALLQRDWIYDVIASDDDTLPSAPLEPVAESRAKSCRCVGCRAMLSDRRYAMRSLQINISDGQRFTLEWGLNAIILSPGSKDVLLEAALSDSVRRVPEITHRQLLSDACAHYHKVISADSPTFMSSSERNREMARARCSLAIAKEPSVTWLLSLADAGVHPSDTERLSRDLAIASSDGVLLVTAHHSGVLKHASRKYSLESTSTVPLLIREVRT